MIEKTITLQEIYNYPAFEKVKDCIVCSSENFFLGKDKDLTLEELHRKRQPTWGVDDMCFGLNRLEKIVTSGEKYLFDVYSDTEIKENGDKANVKLVYFKAKEQTSNKLIILASGGAYGSVCNLAEGFPVAAKLNESGYNCFCLCYRVATKKTFNFGLMPKPLDDLAAAIKFIVNNNDKFNLEVNDYTLIGFSAGGHVVAEFGTGNHGYKQYGVSKPTKLILAYPLIDITAIKGIMKTFFATGLFGTKHSKQTEKDYSVNYNVDSDYPKTYIVQACDDGQIDVNVTKKFAATLIENGIEVMQNFVSSGNHGFGLGSETPARGWVEEALK